MIAIFGENGHFDVKESNRETEKIDKMNRPYIITWLWNNKFNMLLREAFIKKNYETYGIFHMLVDPPPTYGKSSVIFLLSKNDFWLLLRLFNFFLLKVQKYLENIHDLLPRVGVEGGGS